MVRTVRSTVGTASAVTEQDPRRVYFVLAATGLTGRPMIFGVGDLGYRAVLLQEFTVPCSDHLPGPWQVHLTGNEGG